MRKLTIMVVAGALVACGTGSNEPATATPAAEAAPPPYVMPDVLGVEALEDTNPDPNIVEVTLTAGRTTASYKPGASTSVFAYNGLLPGPLLKAKVGDEVIVHFKNDLSEPTTIHWHGLRISDQMDGAPRVHDPVKPGEEFTYRFKLPDAGSYWYHPHMNAPEQVEKGLYAPIVVFDPKRDPVYDAERYLILDDIRLDSAGKIAPPSSMDGMMAGRFGNVLLTNGRPIKEAVASAEQGTVERWRIVNAANARTMEIGIEGASFRVIAVDGGLLPEPYATKRLLVPIGQRFDLEVSYDQPGTAKLVSWVETEDSAGKVTKTPMNAFAVDVAASSRTPRDIVLPAVTLPERAVTANATITLGTTQTGDMVWTLNGEAMPMSPLFTWQQGSTLDLTIVNDIPLEHPFHLHGQFFEIVDAKGSGRDPKQPGLKDVVLLPPNGKVRLRAYIDNPGRWMVHCHILEHAEMGMMGEVLVTPNGSPPPMEMAPSTP